LNLQTRNQHIDERHPASTHLLVTVAEDGSESGQ
jgi:hypothetical protein